MPLFHTHNWVWNGQANGVYYNDIQMHIVLVLCCCCCWCLCVFVLFQHRFLFDLLLINQKNMRSIRWLKKLRKQKRITRRANNGKWWVHSSCFFLSSLSISLFRFSSAVKRNKWIFIPKHSKFAFEFMYRSSSYYQLSWNERSFLFLLALSFAASHVTISLFYAHFLAFLLLFSFVSCVLR